MEPTEPDVPPYILRGQTEYTMFSFNRVIKHCKQSAVLPRPFEHWIQHDAVAYITLTNLSNSKLADLFLRFKR